MPPAVPSRKCLFSRNCGKRTAGVRIGSVLARILLSLRETRNAVAPFRKPPQTWKPACSGAGVFSRAANRKPARPIASKSEKDRAMPQAMAVDVAMARPPHGDRQLPVSEKELTVWERSSVRSHVLSVMSVRRRRSRSARHAPSEFLIDINYGTNTEPELSG